MDKAVNHGVKGNDRSSMQSATVAFASRARYELAMRYSAFVFDAYGTLFDVHAAVRRHATDIGPDGQALSEIWRAKQLEYSWIYTLMGFYADFWALTEEALDYAIAVAAPEAAAVRPQLLAAYRELDAYPEVRDVLAFLKMLK